MKSLALLSLLVLASACTQSRKGIQGATSNTVFGDVDFCTDGNCDGAPTHLVGTLHYTENFIDFRVDAIPPPPVVQLASDESITYRILAKRLNEGTWRRMNWVSVYGDNSMGKSENMNINDGDIIRLKPEIGFVEQYNQWLLEEVTQKGSDLVPYGTGTLLLNINVTYSEIAN